MAGGPFRFLESDRIPFCSRFRVPAAFVLPADFKTSTYRGLSVCHLMPDPPEQTVVTYWRDEPSYRASEIRLCAALMLPPPEQSGIVTSIKSEKDVWWKPKSLSAAVLAVAATFGGISAIREYFAVLFAFPDVTLAYVDAGHVDAVEGDQVAIPVTAISGVRFAPETVRFEAPELQPNGPAVRNWTYDAAIIPTLSAAQPQKVTVIGTAPPHSGRQGGEPDIYHLHVSSTAKAGIITGIFPGRASASDKEIRIWSSKPGHSRLKHGLMQGTLCEFIGEVESSRPYPQGLSVEITLVAGRGEVNALNVSAEGGVSEPQQISDDATAFIGGVRWPALEKFSTHPYRIFVTSARPATQASCEQWVDKMRIGVK
jgi:hypothetical protein